ncbi:Uncharacterized alpha/beta hydrolase domain [Andreprevotia lacus DSM 23236]|jgi:hypothetical protein|uniref:Uncharacterized alpha/beta hydrolase domain n=1 Tax=Andreprevotia lacus DSM 23236 TaxID=1121001 RepID=A0A1W1Y2I7_9NEIS|nr:DUF2235 domain-containing protein [Andreprevotia lacus]SMC29948.1 Uncharacterized alpha/beta hydrolase domain [Andreprevotia lacus DSM 23236]
MKTGFAWPDARPEAGRLAEATHAAQEGSRALTFATAPMAGQVLQINLFFDGADSGRAQDSNVRRLFTLCTPASPEVYAHHVPALGAATPALHEAGGETDPDRLAQGFNARVWWGYVQLLQSLHQRLTGQVLLDDATLGQLCLALGDTTAQPARLDAGAQAAPGSRAAALDQLCKLGERVAERHADQLQAGGVPPVLWVWINLFGFSRGAAAVRVLVNRLAQCWAVDERLAGVFRYGINFVGLFDGVSALGGWREVRGLVVPEQHDGHWPGCAGALVMPGAVRRCVHMVAAHEQRMSMPLDSIAQSGEYEGQVLELAYPGVHDDLGGGYQAGEQGKAPGGASDSLGRIALQDMYLEALRAGVALQLPHQFDDAARAGMACSESLIGRFNAWRKTLPLAHTLADALQFCFGDLLTWRAVRSMPDTPAYFAAQPFYRRATQALPLPQAGKAAAAEDERQQRKSQALQRMQQSLPGLPETARQLLLAELATLPAPAASRIAAGPEDVAVLGEGADAFRLLMALHHPHEQALWQAAQATDGKLQVLHRHRNGAIVAAGSHPAWFAHAEPTITDDILLSPLPVLHAFLADHTGAIARSRLHPASIALYDNDVHDSQAAALAACPREYALGGYAWPRVVYWADAGRMPFLGAAAVQQALAANQQALLGQHEQMLQKGSAR